MMDPTAEATRDWINHRIAQIEKSKIQLQFEINQLTEQMDILNYEQTLLKQMLGEVPPQ